MMSSVFAFGQTATNTEAADSSNVYHLALKLYVQHLGQPRHEQSVLFIEKNDLFTDPLPRQMGGYKIEYIDSYDLQEKLKATKSITVIRIIPLQLKKGVFFIDVISFTVEKESKRNIRYTNSGGEGIVFDFDCLRNGFRFKEIVHGNI